MERKIHTYIEQAFEDAPSTKKTLELKEELISNMVEKYRDRVSQGMSEDEAYKAVVSGLGNIDELVDGVRDRQPLVMPTAKERNKNALIASIAIGLYILSPVTVIFFSVTGNNWLIGITLMFLLVAVATAMLVYNGVSKPRYIREEETMVEEFKEWHSGKNRNKKLRDSLNAAYWTLVVAAYLIWSFQSGSWGISWILFIVAAAVYNILNAVFEIRRTRK